MATKKFRCNVCGYIHDGASAPEKCPVCSVDASQFSEQKKKGAMSDTNSNTYIMVYSTIMVVIVASLLAVTSLSLQDSQYKNELNEKKQSILTSLSAQAESYDDFVKAYVIDAQGNKVEGEDVFNLLKDLQGSFDAGKFPIFEAKDGRVVIPVTGAGLWGPIWGYVALEKDMNTIAGITMAHKGETPGLGAEIATMKHWAMYPGKKIFEGDKFVSVKLRKGGAQDQNHEVDGISGGTKTADGVSAMLFNSIGNYLPLFEAKRGAEAASSEQTQTEVSEEVSADGSTQVVSAQGEQVSNNQNVANNE